MLSGLTAFYLLVAGFLTLICGTVLAFLYRRTVKYHMNQTGGLFAPPLPGQTARAAVSHSDRNKEVARALRAADAAYGRAAAVYAAAGFVHAGIGVVLYFAILGIEFAVFRTMITFWAFAWPVLLTLLLFWGPDRKRQGLTAAGYFLVLALMCLWTGVFSHTDPLHISFADLTLPPFAQPLFFWALLAGPSLFLVIFLNRQVRNVGPVILLFMTIAAGGAMLVNIVYFSAMTSVIQVLGNVVFILTRWLPWLSPGFAVGIVFYGPLVLGALVFAVLAWFVVRWMVRCYVAKKISDQSVMFDSLWLLMTLFLCSELVIDVGVFGWIGLAAFAAYKLVVITGLSPLQRAADKWAAPQLLLLRTFGKRQRSEQLFDLLATCWRYAGNIQLIAGPDLATTALDLTDFLDFVSGRLRRNFIHNDRDLDRRIAAIDRKPDPDGRFRVDSFFCAADAWQSAVMGLIDRVDAILMDLRGFSTKHAGCVFELGTLVDLAAIDRVVLLVDRSTDQHFLQKTLQDVLQRSQTLHAQPRLLQVDSGAAAAVRTFMATVGSEDYAV
jgi:hypothetical protein